MAFTSPHRVREWDGSKILQPVPSCRASVTESSQDGLRVCGLRIVRHCELTLSLSVCLSVSFPLSVKTGKRKEKQGEDQLIGRAAAPPSLTTLLCDFGAGDGCRAAAR